MDTGEACRLQLAKRSGDASAPITALRYPALVSRDWRRERPVPNLSGLLLSPILLCMITLQLTFVEMTNESLWSGQSPTLFFESDQIRPPDTTISGVLLRPPK
jgi:hypothetical protein